MGKGEIARYEQFLLFPQCFQKACFPGASKGVIVWEWVNLTIHMTFPSLACFVVNENYLTQIVASNYKNILMHRENQQKFTSYRQKHEKHYTYTSKKKC